ncbi:PREDICTED: uncharacterized protein LOC108756605 [Trachymyrmex septentrionalis]|uniref:uncharacterized protein LOC108756605 n=1 Tax=Trachymyrmex septentrionalis TaxID=34720 RepID=UPI00084F2289|nr:PREDICTED: uncharacterized protein LOC108756605 [Trachymyrmex septentrionalis]
MPMSSYKPVIYRMKSFRAVSPRARVFLQSHFLSQIGYISTISLYLFRAVLISSPIVLNRCGILEEMCQDQIVWSIAIYNRHLLDNAEILRLLIPHYGFFIMD